MIPLSSKRMAEETNEKRKYDILLKENHRLKLILNRKKEEAILLQNQLERQRQQLQEVSQQLDLLSTECIETRNHNEIINHHDYYDQDSESCCFHFSDESSEMIPIVSMNKRILNGYYPMTQRTEWKQQQEQSTTDDSETVSLAIDTVTTDHNNPNESIDHPMEVIPINEIIEPEQSKIELLQYTLSYEQLITVFLHEVKSRHHVIIHKKYPSIRSSHLFQSYCNFCNLPIPNEQTDNDYYKHFIRLNVGIFNQRIEQLEQLRLSKGYSRKFLLLKERYPYIQYLGAGISSLFL